MKRFALIAFSVMLFAAGGAVASAQDMTAPSPSPAVSSVPFPAAAVSPSPGAREGLFGTGVGPDNRYTPNLFNNDNADIDDTTRMRGFGDDNVRARATDDNDMDWGWLGILGLLGLAGLAGRNRNNEMRENNR